MHDLLTMALAKGRLADQTFDMLEAMGIDCSLPRNPGRQLVLDVPSASLRFIPYDEMDEQGYGEYKQLFDS